MSIVQDLMAGRVGRYSPEQIMRGVQDGLIPAYLGIPAIDQLNKMKQQAQAMASGMQRPQPTIAQQVEAQAARQVPPQMPPQQPQMPPQMPQPGVAGLPSNLPPQGMAGGGIVAFAAGGDPEDATDEDVGDATAPIYKPTGIQALTQPVAAPIPQARPTRLQSQPPINPFLQDAGSRNAALKYVPPEDLSAQYEGLKRPARSAEEAMGQYIKLLGDDTGRAKSEERLAKMEEKAKTAAENAPWMALAQAGFELAATGSIGKAGEKGLKFYGDAQRRAEDLDDRRFDMQAKLAQAQRAEKVAAATYGLGSAEHDRAQNEAVNLQKLNYQTGRASDIAHQNLAVTEKQITTGVELGKAQNVAQHYADWTKVMQQKIAQATAAQQKGEKMAVISSLNDILRTAGPIYQKYQGRPLNMLTDEEKVAFASASKYVQASFKRLAELGGVPEADIQEMFSTPMMPKPTATGPALVPSKTPGAAFDYSSPQLQ